MSVRCFARMTDEPGRRGVWIMTGAEGRQGIFFHGHREEIQAPRYTVGELGKWASQGGFLPIEELSPRELLSELSDWPEGQKEAIAVFSRHGIILGAQPCETSSSSSS